jgi:hypothetical protein
MVLRRGFLPSLLPLDHEGFRRLWNSPSLQLKDEGVVCASISSNRSLILRKKLRYEWVTAQSSAAVESVMECPTTHG